ncbi:hypothetical protein [Nocardiopsis ansamitocini]|nr:hypothetical protein [Nocardiopsis ansamitocini]
MCTAAAALILVTVFPAQAAHGDILLWDPLNNTEYTISAPQGGECYNSSDDGSQFSASRVRNKTDRTIVLFENGACDGRIGAVAAGETYELDVPAVSSLRILGEE